jgi:hypothetical protein
MTVMFKNNVMNNTSKTLLFLIITINILGCVSCNESEAPIISRYSLRIVGPKDNKFNYEEIVSLMQGDSCEDTIFLPDVNSNLTLIDCSDSPKQTSFFVVDKDLYTSTQLTAGSYDWKSVNQKVVNKIKSNFIANVKKHPINNACPDSTLLEKMSIALSTIPVDARYYTFSNDLSNDSLIYPNSTYKHHYTEIESLKTAIKNDLKNNYTNFVVIYNPQVRKVENPNIPILATPKAITEEPVNKKKQEKKESKVANKTIQSINTTQSVSKKEDQINWKQPIRINTDNESYFEWADFGENVTYDYKIEDYDDKKMVDSGTLTENRLNVPSSSIIKDRPYKLTIMAKYKNKNKSEVYVFSVEPNGSISQECKK